MATLAAHPDHRRRPQLCRMDGRVRLPARARSASSTDQIGRNVFPPASARSRPASAGDERRRPGAPEHGDRRADRTSSGGCCATSTATSAWHPAIAASRIEAGEPADTVGAVRSFRLADGSMLREQLIALSDRDRELTYCLLEAPLPAHRLRRLDAAQAGHRGRPDADRLGIALPPPPERAEDLRRMVAEQIYEAGFAALKQTFGTQAHAGLRRAAGAPRPGRRRGGRRRGAAARRPRAGSSKAGPSSSIAMAGRR